MSPTSVPSLCQQIALDLVAQGSVTGTRDEIAFGPWLASYLAGLGCFGPSPDIWTFPVAEGDGRLVVAMLLRGHGARTVVLTGHYDTVTTEDYGQLQHLACHPLALREGLLQRLQGDEAPASALARGDLASGDYLPGRGLLDMKGGLAAGLAAMADLVGAGPLQGNLLFIAVPDEESNSAGARAAAARLSDIARDHHLTIAAAINLDAIADNGDGTAGRVLALGTVGKVLPTAYVVGRPVHSGYPLRGVNAAVLAAAISAQLEWAPELTDDTANVPGTAASLLSFKDGKAGYDVTTPGSAYLFWNVINLARDPGQVLAVVEKLVRQATVNCMQTLADRAAGFAHADQPDGVDQRVDIFWYSALLAEVAARDPGVLTALQTKAETTAGLDLPERCRQMTALLWERSARTGPAVILGLGSTPYLATRVQDAHLSAAIVGLIADAPSRHGTVIKSEPYFAGISDMSFFGQADDTAFAALAPNTPVWDAAIALRPGALAQVPTINLGPWGRDYHTPLERIHCDYGFRVLPGLIGDLVQRVLAD